MPAFRGIAAPSRVDPTSGASPAMTVWEGKCLPHPNPTSSSIAISSGRAAIRTADGAGGGQRRRDLAGETIMYRRQRGPADGVMRGAVEIGLRAAGGKMQHAVELALRQRRRDRRRKVIGLERAIDHRRCARAGRRRRDRRRGPRRRDRAAARGRWTPCAEDPCAQDRRAGDRRDRAYRRRRTGHRESRRRGQPRRCGGRR